MELEPELVRAELLWVWVELEPKFFSRSGDEKKISRARAEEKCLGSATLLLMR